MYIVRFSTRSRSQYGVLEGKVIRGFRGSPFTQPGSRRVSFAPDGRTYKLGEVKLLAPCLPSKIIGLGLNYRQHAEEIKEQTKMSLPTVPLIFLKPPSAVIGPEEKIVLPSQHGRVDYEGELGVVIGRKAKDVPQNKAGEYILGYTCFNDVSERKNQNADVQWTRAKGYDTFAPFGPCISTGISADDLKIETYLNGECRQSSRTSYLLFGIPELVSFISGVMTLLPGDVIATGTPAGIGEMNPGDVVEVKIEKIGTLKNFVVGQS